MPSVNKAIVMGFLGHDPDVRYMPDGTAAATISVATTDKWKDKTSGEKKEATEWHRVVFFGKMAEIVKDYLKKGSAIYVEGRLQTKKWTDKQGIDRYTTQIVAEDMQMLGGSRGSSAPPPEGDYAQPPAAPAAQRTAAPRPAVLPNVDDDIPF